MLFISHIDQVVGPIYDEMNIIKLIFLTPMELQLYQPDKHLFGEDVDKAFPSIQYEIEEAGKCMAFSRWTAGVMHLMRALEVPLAALEKAANVEVRKENWNGKIDQIELKIRQIKKSNSPPGDEAWFAEATTSFFFIKNAWRNYAAHGKDKYDQERASSIYNACRGLVRHLATRLSE